MDVRYEKKKTRQQGAAGVKVFFVCRTSTVRRPPSTYSLTCRISRSHETGCNCGRVLHTGSRNYHYTCSIFLWMQVS